VTALLEKALAEAKESYNIETILGDLSSAAFLLQDDNGEFEASEDGGTVARIAANQPSG